MKIAVTGGCGFIGSHLVHRLIKDHIEVLVLKRVTSDTWRNQDIEDSIEYANVDDSTNFAKLFRDKHIDYLIHLATTYLKSHSTPEETNVMDNGNIVFPSKILQAAILSGVKGFINTGTCFEYDLGWRSPIVETNFKKAYNYYAATKTSFETLLEYMSREKSFPSITLKLFYPYGPKDNLKLITMLCLALKGNKSINITAGEQNLCYTYIDDIVEAYLLTLKYLEEKWTCYESINIGSKNTCEIRTIVSILERLSHKKGIINLGVTPYQNNEIMFVKCSNSKAKSLLNWSPRTRIDDGLKKTFNYYKEGVL